MSQGCAASIALNYDPTAALPCYDCCLFPREGCMEPTALNYDPEANIAGSCYIRGCMDSRAPNYTPSATADDGSCNLVYGCTHPLADNYRSLATVDDDSCIFVGCTDPAAVNYLSLAQYDDGRCEYAPPPSPPLSPPTSPLLPPSPSPPPPPSPSPPPPTAPPPMPPSTPPSPPWSPPPAPPPPASPPTPPPTPPPSVPPRPPPSPQPLPPPLTPSTPPLGGVSDGADSIVSSDVSAGTVIGWAAVVLAGLLALGLLWCAFVLYRRKRPSELLRMATAAGRSGRNAVCSTETCDPTLVRLEVHASGAEAVETRAPRQAPPLSAGDVVVDLAHVRGPLEEETLATSTDGRGSSSANPAAPDAATRGVGRGLAGVAMVEPVEERAAPDGGDGAPEELVVRSMTRM